MGQLFEFGCSKCGYQAEVSGGEDVGNLIVIRTMVCRDCARLVDVVGWNLTSVQRQAIPTFSSAPTVGAPKRFPGTSSGPAPDVAVKR